MNVSEWTQVIVWIALVLVLGVVEVFTLDFIFLMLAAGAAGGLIAALLGAPWWLSAIIAAVLALLLLAVVRPPRAPRAEPWCRPTPHRRRGSGRHGRHGRPRVHAVRPRPGPPGQR
ncbi:hypothetical protein [Curtobacterium sp. MCPF17_052]|uniref:hypothetical protein n=1 Tax=Curtobacterium sp. MCPF17_052 TaxID=2175655 RepID=UPI0024DF7E7C|nr:hypothetical protein [Curtobacterium sp. MCPF17_052]WIB12698.1 hypothetical protein DEJ36_00805 [Curtobacterium sp. MCPF17_052]